ncbi:hypothetical protein ACHQM5_012716 [Ranunculus cassubicifolius]
MTMESNFLYFVAKLSSLSKFQLENPRFVSRKIFWSIECFNQTLLPSKQTFLIKLQFFSYIVINHDLNPNFALLESVVFYPTVVADEDGYVRFYEEKAPVSNFMPRKISGCKEFLLGSSLQCDLRFMLD